MEVSDISPQRTEEEEAHDSAATEKLAVSLPMHLKCDHVMADELVLDSVIDAASARLAETPKKKST